MTHTKPSVDAVQAAREALKPCPFCGGPVKLERANDTRDSLFGTRKWWGVVCRNTINVGGSCAIQQRPSASEEAAIKRWNRRAALAAAAPADAGESRVPAGWKLVPMEPTLDMGWAYLDAAGESDPLREHSFNHAGYRAMLAAAPEAPEPLPAAEEVGR